MTPQQIAKAIAAAAGTFTTALTAAALEGGVSGVEWACVAAGTIGAAALTYRVPNARPEAEPPLEHGETA